jgi:hypothetical protein
MLPLKINPYETISTPPTDVELAENAAPARFRWTIVPATFSVLLSVLFGLGLVLLLVQSVESFETERTTVTRFVISLGVMAIALLLAIAFNIFAARWWLKNRILIAIAANFAAFPTTYCAASFMESFINPPL